MRLVKFSTLKRLLPRFRRSWLIRFEIYILSPQLDQQYEKFFAANDPAKGGSFYLQSKIFRAKEALLKEAMEAAESEQEKTQK